MGFGLITIKQSNGQRWICLRPTTSMEQQQQGYPKIW
jgi:hypothetical protein